MSDAWYSEFKQTYPEIYNIIKPYTDRVDEIEKLVDEIKNLISNDKCKSHSEDCKTYKRLVEIKIELGLLITRDKYFNNYILNHTWYLMIKNGKVSDVITSDEISIDQYLYRISDIHSADIEDKKRTISFKSSDSYLEAMDEFITLLKGFLPTYHKMLVLELGYSSEDQLRHINEWSSHRYAADIWLASLIRQQDKAKHEKDIQELQNQVNELNEKVVQASSQITDLKEELYIIKCKYAPELPQYDYDEIKRRLNPIRAELKKMHRIISRTVQLTYDTPVAYAFSVEK